MSGSLWPHGLQHARLPCPSLAPGVRSNSCPLSQWCHPIISSSVTSSPPALNLSQHQGVFQWVGSLHQVAKVLELQLQHQSFQWILGLISFRMDWLDLLTVQGAVKNSPAAQSESINSLVLCLLYGSTLTSVCDNCKNYSFNYMDHCWQSAVSAF